MMEVTSRFKWTIENFPRLNKTKQYSEVFTAGGYKWRVLVYPKGNNVDHLSVYLDVADSGSLPSGWSRYAQFSLSIVNQMHSKNTVRKDTQHQFNARESDWGFTSFMPLSDLYDPSGEYLVNDTCVIEAEVTVHKVVDNWTYDANLYTTIKVARDGDLAEQIGHDIYFDLVDHDKVCRFRIQKQMPFSQFKEEVAKVFGIPAQFQRFWLWTRRQNNTYRPDRPLTPQEEAQSVGQLGVSNKAHNTGLKLFLEVELGQDLCPLPLPDKTKENILLFFKLYDPEKEELRYVGRLFVRGQGKPADILMKLNEMAGFPPNEEIELFEEIKFEPSIMCEHLDKKLTFRFSQLEDGDIICYQRSPPLESDDQYCYPDVPSFLGFVRQHPQPELHRQPMEVTSRFVWKIECFSRLNTKKEYSEVFTVGGYKWRVMIYPKGNNVADHLSLYLDVADSGSLPNGWSRHAQFVLSIVNKMHSKNTIRKDTQHQFNAQESDWGFTSFMPLSNLYDSSGEYLVNDTCVIEAEVTVHKVVDNWTYDANLYTTIKMALTPRVPPMQPHQIIGSNGDHSLNHCNHNHQHQQMELGLAHHAPAQNSVIMGATELSSKFEATLTEINAIISAIVGLDGVKLQLRKWIKGLVLYCKRKDLGIKVGTRKALHMAFLGNPGTGKTMVARLLAKVLHNLGLASTDKVIEVQRTDLVAEYIGQTGVKTRLKIKEASGGILFVDEAYRLVLPNMPKDFGVEALEEIMSAMDSGDIITIFAGYGKEMERVISANAGFSRRVSKVFYFDDYTPIEIAHILHSKVKSQKEDTSIYGYKLHHDCTVKAIASLIKEHIPDEELKKLNGGLVDPLLINSLENLDLRLDVNCMDVDTLTTITMKDLEEGLKSFSKSKENVP